MNHNLPTDSHWYLVTIDDYPRMLTGETFFKILKLIQESENIKFVILNDIEGAGTYGLISSLRDDMNEVLKIEEVLIKTNNLDHLEWGDFFLFKECPKDWDNPGDWDYPHLIAQADTTLRAVDDQYMYIYTRSAYLVEVLKSKYELESIKIDLLEKLDFPY